MYLLKTQRHKKPVPDQLIFAVVVVVDFGIGIIQLTWITFYGSSFVFKICENYIRRKRYLYNFSK